MAQNSQPNRQLMDWSAALWAGLIAGGVFLVLNLFWVPSVIGGNHWSMLRLFASIVLGENVVAPPASFSASVLVVSVITHFALSIAFAVLLAFIIHRWGLLVGVLGGGVFGLALYFVNVYSLSFFFPWFFALHGWSFIVTHVIFGAVAGAAYESLEEEQFVAA